MTKIASNLQIDSARLWDTIHETAKFGATPKGGVRRLTLGPEDKQVRDWFRTACEAAGLDVHVDALGSMFGLRKGRDMSKPPVGLGSHLDTQPTGGKFDGVLGTLAALEVVRTLNDAGIETETPICIVNWTNEEGSRFAPATMASAAYAGDYTTENILARRDAAGVTVGEALDGIGYRGSEAVGARKLGAFVELHIEQGPLLEAENKTIGVVERGQGIVWYDGKVTGFESHAGTTPMPLRRDALATLSEIVLAVERIAKAHGPNAVGTVGEALIAAPSRNVIPGEIAFTVDIRSPGAETLDAIDKDLRSAIAEIAPRRKVEIALDAIWRKEPTVFNAKLVDAVESATKALGYSHRRITSGAGHDACNLAIVDHTALPTEVARKCAGLKHVVFLGTGARSYMNPEELAELGIAVHLIRGYGDTAVAESTIALIWAAARGIAQMDREMRAGNWLREDGMQLTGKTLGLIGFGGIAAEVARIALGGGMRVIAWNRSPKKSSKVEFVELDELLTESDVVSLHLLLNDEPRGFISRACIEAMKPGVTLVNTARGALVDQDALIQALP